MTKCPGCGNYIPIKDEVCYHCQPNHIPTQKIIEVKYTPITDENKNPKKKSFFQRFKK